MCEMYWNYKPYALHLTELLFLDGILVELDEFSASDIRRDHIMEVGQTRSLHFRFQKFP